MAMLKSKDADDISTKGPGASGSDSWGVWKAPQEEEKEKSGDTMMSVASAPQEEEKEKSGGNSSDDSESMDTKYEGSDLARSPSEDIQQEPHERAQCSYSPRWRSTRPEVDPRDSRPWKAPPPRPPTSRPTADNHRPGSGITRQPRQNPNQPPTTSWKCPLCDKIMEERHHPREGTILRCPDFPGCRGRRDYRNPWKAKPASLIRKREREEGIYEL